MLAVGASFYGGLDAIGVVDVPMPEPGAGEVRVRVAAATVNHGDLHLFRGTVAGLVTGPPPYVAGMEAAGVVDAVGSGADWSVGDEVVVHAGWIPQGRGAQAEYVVVHSDQVARAPRGTSMVEAATVPMNALTADIALDRVGAEPGRTVAVVGAAGAVGGYAVQLAVERGCRVVAVAGDRDEDLVRRLGAHEFVSRGDGCVPAVRGLIGGGVDGMVDTADIGDAFAGVVRDGGRIVSIGLSDVTPGRGIVVGRVAVSRENLRSRYRLERLCALVDRRVLTPRVAETHPAHEAATAYRRVAQGGLRGRVVLTF